LREQAIVEPEALGAFPEPHLALTVRMILQVLSAVHSRGLAFADRLDAGTVWLATDGTLKLTVLQHMHHVPRKELKKYAFSQDLHNVLDLCDRLGNAKKMKMVRPRHEVDFELKMLKEKLEAMKAEKLKLDANKHKTLNATQESARQHVHDESKLSNLNSEIARLQVWLRPLRPDPGLTTRGLQQAAHFFFWHEIHSPCR
jgi:hypothetical protein